MTAPRVFIVDDQPLNRELIHAYLDDSGYELHDAASGEEAIELALRVQPDLVLLDIMMPGIGGFETTHRLKELAGERFLPIILLTSLSDSASRLRGLSMGADEFLTKPVDRQELAVRVKNLLALRAKDILLAERNLALAELNRFKDEMSALIVHDLKNPMQVILAAEEFIAPALTQPHHLEALEDSRSAGRHVMRLIANLLDVAQLEAGRLALRRVPTRLDVLLADVLHERRLLAQARHLTVELDAPSTLTIEADRDLLTRAVENVVDNAFRHTPADGRIALHAEPRSHNFRIEIGNTGQPIPPEARAVIFEKYGQATPAAGRMNLGLGLYFCRLALEAHRGNIWVEQRPKLPTVFVMQLPA